MKLENLEFDSQDIAEALHSNERAVEEDMRINKNSELSKKVTGKHKKSQVRLTEEGYNKSFGWNDETDADYDERIFGEDPSDPKLEGRRPNDKCGSEEIQARPHPKGSGFRGKNDPNFTRNWHPERNYTPKRKLGSEEEKIVMESKDREQSYNIRKEEGNSRWAHKRISGKGNESKSRLVFSTKKDK